MRLITGDECGLLKECIPELSTSPEEEEKNEAISSVPSRRRVLVSKDKGVLLLNQDYLVQNSNTTGTAGADGGLRRRGVVDLTWTSSSAHDDSQFASLHMDGTVQIWRSRDHDDNDDDSNSNNNNNPFRFARYRRASEISNIFGGSSDETDAEVSESTTMMDPLSQPIGLYAFDSKSGASSSNVASSSSCRLVACNAQGSVSILNPNNNSSDDNGHNIVRTFETVKGNKTMTATPTTKNIARLEYPNITSTALDGRNTISGAGDTPSSSRIALGGRDRDVMIWDLESAQQVFKAKNLPPDPVTLLQPLVWPTAMCFMQNSTAFDASPHILAVGTAYCQVRIYDVRVQQAVATAKTFQAASAAPRKQRPLAYSPIKNVPHLPLEHRVTALCPMDANHLIVGDAAGYLQTMDLRLLEKNTSWTAKKNKGQQSHSSLHAPPQPSCVVGRFVGPGGSVRGLAQHADGNTLAAVGLDRMLRVYDNTTRKQVYCMYLKQRLNCVLFGRQEAAKKKKRYNGSSSKSSNNNNDSENDDDDDYDSEELDADDVVEDYVDSSDEEEAGNSRNQSDDDKVAERRKHANEDGEGGSSSSSEDDDDDDESEDESSDSSEDDDDDDEAPRKRRRR